MFGLWPRIENMDAKEAKEVSRFAALLKSYDEFVWMFDQKDSSVGVVAAPEVSENLALFYRCLASARYFDDMRGFFTLGRAHVRNIVDGNFFFVRSPPPVGAYTVDQGLDRYFVTKRTEIELGASIEVALIGPALKADISFLKNLKAARRSAAIKIHYCSELDIPQLKNLGVALQKSSTEELTSGHSYDFVVVGGYRFDPKDYGRDVVARYCITGGAFFVPPVGSCVAFLPAQLEEILPHGLSGFSLSVDGRVGMVPLSSIRMRRFAERRGLGDRAFRDAWEIMRRESKIGVVEYAIRNASSYGDDGALESLKAAYTKWKLLGHLNTFSACEIAAKCDEMVDIIRSEREDIEVRRAIYQCILDREPEVLVTSRSISAYNRVHEMSDMISSEEFDKRKPEKRGAYLAALQIAEKYSQSL